MGTLVTEAAPAKPSTPEPGTPASAAQVRAQIVETIKENLTALTKAYNEAMKKKADQQAKKKPAGKETPATEAKKKAE